MSNSWTNNGISELTIPTNATTGERITINTGQDGAILIYNTAGQLIGAISPAGGTGADGTPYIGGFDSIFPPTGQQAVLDGSILRFESPAIPALVNQPSVFSPPVSTISSLQINSGNLTGENASGLILASGTVGGPKLANIFLEQEEAGGTVIGGTALQNDDNTGNGTAPKFVHTGLFSITTDVNGDAVFDHGAAFTPTLGWLVGVQGAGNPFYQYAWFSNPFTSTTANANFKTSAGANYASATLPAFGIFVG